MTKLEFFKDAESNLLLENKSFQNETFENVNIVPVLGTKVIFQDVKFFNCKIAAGSFTLRYPAELIDVIFSDFQCGTQMTIDSEVQSNRTIIEGQYPKYLEIKPCTDDHDFKLHSTDGVDFFYDITNYLADFMIFGYPISKMKYNPET